MLNRAETKRVILERIKELRPQLGVQITRVGCSAYAHLECVLLAAIDAQIMAHPSKGKTFQLPKYHHNGNGQDSPPLPYCGD